MPIDQSLSAQPSANPSQGPMPPAAQGVQSPNDAAGPGLKFAQDLLALHQAKQNSAMSEMDKNLKAAEAGFPVDAMHIAKLAKKAGIKIDTSPEAIASFISERTGNTKGGHPQQPGQGGQGGGPTMGGHTPPPQGAPPQQAQGQGQQQPKMTKEQQREALATHWAQNAISAAQKRGESTEKLAQLQGQVTQLKSDVLNGSPEQQRQATGKLMAINEIPFTIQAAEWNAASPSQRGSMIDIAAGHESDAEFQTRATGISNAMISSGRFTDPAASMQYASAIAKGQAPPPEAAAKMKPFTMTELTQQATQAGEFVNLGVPPDRLKSVMAAAAIGGVAYALPTGLNPLMIKQIQQKDEELKIEKERVGVEQGQVNVEATRALNEQKRYNSDALKADAAAQKAENQEFFENFQAIVAMEKAKKGSVPTEVMNAYVAQLADRSGLEVTESRSWMNYLTFGTMGGKNQVFSPKPAPGVAQDAAGKSPNAPEGSPNKQTPGGGISKFYKAAKRAASGETTD
jgi:hypothetical protein